MANEPAFPDPLEVRLDEVELQADNSLRVGFELDTGELVTIELSPSSDEMARVIDVLTEVATASLHRIGNRGFRVVGFTPTTAGDAE